MGHRNIAVDEDFHGVATEFVLRKKLAGIKTDLKTETRLALADHIEKESKRLGFEMSSQEKQGG